MTYFAAAILGVIQGLTEFLPISSTAHLLIAEEWLGFDDPGGVFTVMIQLGAVLAVMWLYRAKILNVVSRLPVDAEARRFAAAVIVAFIPAAVAIWNQAVVALPLGLTVPATVNVTPIVAWFVVTVGGRAVVNCTVVPRISTPGLLLATIRKKYVVPTFKAVIVAETA